MQAAGAKLRGHGGIRYIYYQGEVKQLVESTHTEDVYKRQLYGHPLQREVAFLTVHSMLHLLGYDHENGGLEAMRMREKEEAVLIQLGLPRTVSYTE